MFNNANEVKINGKTVQSIKTMGGGNLYMKPNPLPTLYIDAPQPQLLVDGQYISGIAENGLYKFNVSYGAYTVKIMSDEYVIKFTTDGQVIDPKTTPPK